MRRQQQPHVPISPPSVSSGDPEFCPIGGAISSPDDDADVLPVMEKRRALNRRRKLIRLLCAIVLALLLFGTLSLLSCFRQPPRIEELSEWNSGSENVKDELLGGLLSPEFNTKSCISRHKSPILRRSSLQKPPSPHLLHKLRSYEALHRKCGPGTELYRQASLLLKSNQSSPPSSSSPCKYLIWISFSGLGNRILTLAAAFLYALLTDRILLIDRSQNMDSLFCEPFPNQTWLLPLNFPLPLHQFHSNSSPSFGNLLRNKLFKPDLPFTYLHLSHDYTHHDKLFFCEQQQSSLKSIPWLILRSDNYFVPSLFLIPSFRLELDLLFPYKDLVFHHLGRYLFHPSNSVWGMISRFHRSYLQDSDEKIGIQIRVFDSSPGPFPHVVDQVLSCVMDNNLLPKIKNSEGTDSFRRGRKKKAVLVTSLRSEFFQKVKNMYWENGVEEDQVVSVYQPSCEEHQRSSDRIHGMKAWAEMYLLSLTDVLVTSAWSTFGYVAQGMGGMTPWVLVKAENRTVPVPPCRRGESMEPCFHAPPFYDCEKGRGVDTGKIVPYVRHCEDVSWGIKLVGYGGR